MLHFKTILAIFKNNTHISKHLTKHWNIFQKTNIFVYILTNENHYKDCLNEWPLLQNNFKTTLNTFSNNKSNWSKKVTKSPWKTMEEKGANTFLFHNLPPKLKKQSQRYFLYFFTFTCWIKENSVATLAKPQHLQTQTQNPQVSSSTVSNTSITITMVRNYIDNIPMSYTTDSTTWSDISTDSDTTNDTLLKSHDFHEYF